MKDFTLKVPIACLTLATAAIAIATPAPSQPISSDSLTLSSYTPPSTIGAPRRSGRSGSRIFETHNNYTPPQNPGPIRTAGCGGR